MTVVVEAAERSGSLTTADFAAELGRTVAAVPGRITSALAEGHERPAAERRAAGLRASRDVLDLLAEATGRAHRRRPPPAPAELDAGAPAAAGRGRGGERRARRARHHPAEARAVLAGLGELEFRGLVRRTFGGRYERAV